MADNFNSLDQVISALRDAGLESSNLLPGIDFTKSNEWTGRHSFHQKSLHTIATFQTPMNKQFLSLDVLCLPLMKIR